MANNLALRLGFLSKNEVFKISETLKKFNLPTTFKIPNADEFYELFFMDKKTQNSKIKFILANSIGEFKICTDIPKDVVMATLKDFE